MAFKLPTFNLLASIWDCRFPADGSADHSSIACQKYINSRLFLDMTPQANADWWQLWQPVVMLRFSRSLSIFSGPSSAWVATSFEIPQGSKQYYRTYWRDVMHEGFPNEYAIVLVTQCDDTGKAIPPAGASLPTGVAADLCFIPTPVLTLHDTFDDSTGTLLSAHTMNLGPGWTDFGTGCDYIESVTGDSVSVNTTGSALFPIMFSDAGITDGTCITDWLQSGFGDDTFGCVCRAVTGDNSYCCYWDVVNSRGVFSKVVSGSETILGTVSIPGIPLVTDVCRVTVKANNHTFDCTYRNVTSATQWTQTVVDSTFTAGTNFGILSKTDETEFATEFSVFTL